MVASRWKQRSQLGKWVPCFHRWFRVFIFTFIQWLGKLRSIFGWKIIPRCWSRLSRSSGPLFGCYPSTIRMDRGLSVVSFRRLCSDISLFSALCGTDVFTLCFQVRSTLWKHAVMDRAILNSEYISRFVTWCVSDCTIEERIMFEDLSTGDLWLGWMPFQRRTDGGGCVEVAMTKTSTRMPSNGTRTSCKSSLDAWFLFLFWFVFLTLFFPSLMQEDICRFTFASFAGPEGERALLRPGKFPRRCPEWDRGCYSDQSLGEWNQSCTVRSTWVYINVRCSCCTGPYLILSILSHFECCCWRHKWMVPWWERKAMVGWIKQCVSRINFLLEDDWVCLNLAAMSDFWRTRNTWLPTWSTTNVEERSLVM